ncbi:hypothetical protein [Pantoea allii]|uniref:hypothetical protein n=1 Tax=Pantoea allii TaxID=574096 RepID=UPI000A234107|nr:hypothetical protein [Pantoea allii]MBW1254010.1 hypothetical protein [Pantoea allii]MBW1263053.1 hypothetical protein [Pantoea allii]MBW1285132.1 hypothetical protein [Pantoea allii]ORM88427.1 hypothetical protein HA38_04070 [Pantoea allii]PBJ99967.1 hypothetical protein CMR03_12420 [Pantoea allii]
MDGFQGAAGRTQPETRIQLVRLPDDQKQAVMICQMASIPARDAGALFVKAEREMLFMLNNQLLTYKPKTKHLSNYMFAVTSGTVHGLSLSSRHLGIKVSVHFCCCYFISNPENFDKDSYILLSKNWRFGLFCTLGTAIKTAFYI